MSSAETDTRETEKTTDGNEERDLDESMDVGSPDETSSSSDDEVEENLEDGDNSQRHVTAASLRGKFPLDIAGKLSFYPVEKWRNVRCFISQ